MKRYLLQLCLILLVSGNGKLLAQANRISTEHLLTNDEKARLADLGRKYENSYKANYSQALMAAKRNNWPLVMRDSSGNISVLHGLSPNGMPIYYTTANANAAVTIRTNKVYPGGGAGYNLTGKYRTLGIWDVGAVRTSHEEFGGRVVYKDNARTIESHPTHVAGTMVGAGKDPKARGMAYEAYLWAYDSGNDLAEMAAAAKEGLPISNHSYGAMYGWYYNDKEKEWYWYGDTTISSTTDYHYGFYDNESKSLDEIAFNAKHYLIVFAAHNVRGIEPPTLNTKHKIWANGKWIYSTGTRNSNNNFDCLNGLGVAKNVLTVGAVNPVNYSGPSSVVMSGFSAWGPTDDGRIKPDIVGDGVGVYSADYQSDTAYGYKNGTSMATPSVSGSLLLVQEQYAAEKGTFMNAATLKAIAIHTADETGPNPGPDYMFGWGLMNTEKAIDVVSNKGGNHTIKNGILFKNIELNYDLPADGQSAYRITLVWTDPAGTVSAPSLNSRTPKLVNDLDLLVYDPEDGEKHYPWRLNPANPAAAATRGDNFRDNVEVIDIPYLPKIDYKIKVSHKGQLANNQPFSLIISKIPIVIPELQISSSVSTPVCPGKQVQYSQTVQDDFFTKYAWSFPYGTPSSYVGKIPPKVTYNTPGEYDVVLVASNDKFTRVFKMATKTVVSDPQPGTVTISQICQDSKLYVTGKSTGKYFNDGLVSWYVNNVLVKPDGRLFYLFDGSNLKNGDVVRAEVSATSSCKTAYKVYSNSIVIQKPAIAIPKVSISSPSEYFCTGGKITVTPHVTNKSDVKYGYNYWYVNGKYYNDTEDGVPVSYWPDASASEVKIYCIYVAHTECSGTLRDTSQTLVFKRGAPFNPVVSISTPKTKICNGEWVEITGTTNIPESGRQVMWYLNGMPYSEGFNTVGFTLKNGDKVYCKITSTNPCASQSEVISNEITFIGTDMLFPTVSIRATKTSICQNEVVTFFADATDKGTNPTYKWYHNLDLVKSGPEATYGNSALQDLDEITCIMVPDQCTYNDMAYSNRIVMSVRGPNDSKLSIVASETAVCAGTSVTFTATLTKPGSFPVYNWKINGQVVSSTENKTFTTDQLQDGDIVDCSVSQTTGCMSFTPVSNQIKMSVFPISAPVISIANVTPMCDNAVTTFKATATHTNPATTYQWIVSGETKQNSTSDIFNASGLKNNDFVNCIMFTRSACATSNTAASNYIQVELGYGNQGDITIHQSNFKICENEPARFELYNSNFVPGSVYQWKINGEIVETKDFPGEFSTTALKDKDVVSATFISGNVCVNPKEYHSNEIPIEIIHASPTISIEATSFCKGTPITFYAVTTNVPKGSLYYWKKNGSYEDTGEDSTYTPPYFNPGDIISCTLFPKACTAEDEYYSNQITIPEMPDIQPSIEIQADGITCPGQFATFRAVTKDEGENPTYIWYKNGKLILADHFPTITFYDFKEGDILTCTLVSSEPCALGKLVASEPFVIHPASPVNVNLNITARYPKVCEGQAQEFSTTVSVPQNQLTYQWSIDGYSVEDSISSTFTSGNLGTDSKISCTVQSDKICIDANTATKTVSSNIVENLFPEIQIKSSSSQNCKGQEAVFTATTKDAGTTPDFEWFVNEISVQKGTSDTFKSALLSDGDKLTCHLMPKDICSQESTIASNVLTVDIIESETSTIVIKQISTIICENGISEFQADATHAGANAVYEWKINDEVIQSGENYNFTTDLLQNGDVVSCNLLREDFCSGEQIFESNTITITTSPKSTPSVSIRLSENGNCEGQPVQLIAEATHGGTFPVYKWYVNDELVAYDSKDTLELHDAEDGDIVFCVLVSNEECITDEEVYSNDIIIQKDEIITPAVSISASNSFICPGTGILVTATAQQGGSQPVYDWKINDISVQRGTSNTFYSEEWNDGDVIQCTLESSSPCVTTPTAESDPITINVINDAIPTLIINTLNEIQCKGTTLEIEAAYTNALRPVFIWKVNGGEVQRGMESTFSSDNLNTGDIITCVMESVGSCGQNVTTSNEIIVPELLDAVEPSIEIIPLGILCEGQNTRFRLVTKGLGDNPAFAWYRNYKVIYGGTDFELPLEVRDGDTLTCILLTSVASCATTTMVMSEPYVMHSTIPVNANLQLAAKYSQVCIGQPQEFITSVSVPENQLEYIWELNGFTVENAASSTWSSASLNPDDEITCMVRSGEVCVIPDSKTVSSGVSDYAHPVFFIQSASGTQCKGAESEFVAETFDAGIDPVFEWFINNISIQKGTENSFKSSQLSNGDIVTCHLIPNGICIEGEYLLSNAIAVELQESVIPQVYISASGNSSCAGTEISFTAEAVNPGSHPVYIWKVNGETVKRGTENTFVSESLQNNDMVACEMISDLACAVPSVAVSGAVQIIRVESVQPSVEIVPLGILCDGQSTLFRAVTHGGGSSPYFVWYRNGEMFYLGRDSILPVAVQEGGDTLTCEFVSNDPCFNTPVASAPYVLELTEGNTNANLQLTVKYPQVCIGQMQEFITTVSVPEDKLKYIWRVNGEIVEGANSPSWSSSSLNPDDQISCRIESDQICIFGDLETVSSGVSDYAHPVFFIQSAPGTQCKGEEAEFVAETFDAGVDPVFDWFVNDVSVQKGADNSFKSTSLDNGDVVTCHLIPNGICIEGDYLASNEIAVEIGESVTPQVTVSVSGNSSCAGTEISFTAAAVHGGSQPVYIWKVNGETVNQGSENTFASASLENNDVVVCEMISDLACAVPSNAVSDAVQVVRVESVEPSIQITADKTEICAGTSAVFTTETTHGGTYPAYEWKVNGNTVQSGAESTYITDALQNNDVVTVTLFSDVACLAQSSATSEPVRITVIPVLQPEVEISSSETSVCTGSEIIFTAAAKNTYGNASYEWKVNGITVQLGTPNEFKSDIWRNNDQISCIVHVSNECASVSDAVSNTIQIEVTEPNIPLIEIKNHYDSICNDTRITLELSMVNVSSGTAYQWYKNGTVVGNEDKLSITNLADGDEIWCSISTKATNCDVTMSAVSDTFTAKVYPVTEFEVYQKGDTLFATAGYLAYNWYFDGRLIAKGMNNFIVPEVAGAYTVNVTDPKGCAGISRTIDFVPTSVRNITNNTYRIYPNPTNGKVQIEFSAYQSGIVSVHHINGQLILQPTEIHHLKNYSLDLSRYPEGMYIITFEQPDRKWSEKIIKMQ